MDKYFTVMVIPEREKGVKSFRIPKVIFRGFVFFSLALLFLIGILSYDYFKILKQVYKNKHLTIENRQLKEQIELFDRKINTITADLERIHIFEKKLRVITGVEKSPGANNLVNFPNSNETNEASQEGSSKRKKTAKQKDNSTSFRPFKSDKRFKTLKDKELIEKTEGFKNLKNLYEQKIATNFGLQTGYAYTKEWSELTKRSFALANQFAKFDYQFNEVRDKVKDLEIRVHQVDQHLLDRDSFLKSTPTLLPAQGWITSYYGPRRSHYSGRLKMHEGLDIGARPGSGIIAPADGMVTFSGRKPGFGYFVQIDHGYGVETIYAHAKKLLVKKGRKVLRGQKIATVGSTGLSTGPHVHYEVRINGTPVDPLYYILD